MKLNLFFKIYLPILFTITFILFMYGYVNLKDQEKSYLNIMEAQTQSIVKSFILLNTEEILGDDKAQLITKSLDILADNQNLKYILFDKVNSFKLVIKKEGFDILDNLGNEYTRLYIKNTNYDLIHNGIYDEKVFNYSYKIEIAKFVWGWVHLGISLDEYNKQLEKIYDNFIKITLVSIILTIVFTYFLVKKITVPITQLSKSVNEITIGELKELDLSDNSNDEIGQLKRDFNYMVRYLKNIKMKEKYIFQQSKLNQMSEMLTNIAHQWRQPLSVISMGLSGIKLKRDMGILEENDFKESYELVMSNAKYLTNTINKFDKLSKESENVDLSDFIDSINNAIEYNKDMLNNNKVQISLDNNCEDISLKINSEILIQILSTFFTNSCNAFERNDIYNRKISLTIKDNDFDIFLLVHDNAGGIKEEILDNIFEPYFTTNHKFIGVGMGLYFTYDLIKNRLKGDLEVRNYNNGVLFTIKLPKKL